MLNVSMGPLYLDIICRNLQTILNTDKYSFKESVIMPCNFTLCIGSSLLYMTMGGPNLRQLVIPTVHIASRPAKGLVMVTCD